MNLTANRGGDLSAIQAAELELNLAIENVSSDAVREGLSAFVEMRAPRFR